MKQYTPMIQQYLQIKADYPDAFLFFRLGDFYEMFFDDAIKASRELEITLTSRDGGAEEKVPMCGVPYHSAQTYIERLIEKGYKVAICEQMEDPKQAKGVVKREVIQLITPGTMIEGKGIRDKENNFLATMTPFPDGTIGFAYADLSTGESKVTLFDSAEDCFNEISTIRAKEIVLSEDFPEDWEKRLKDFGVQTISREEDTSSSPSFEKILRPVNGEKLQRTLCRLLHYIFRTQKRNLEHLQPAEFYQIRQYMKIDHFSKRNLELTETVRTKDKKGSLLWFLDETMTAMGGRLLKQWIDRPLLSKKEIERRHQMVGALKDAYLEREELRESLKKVYDIERLSGKISFGNANARDLLQLKQTLREIPAIKEILLRIPDEAVHGLAETLDPCPEIAELIEKAIRDDPPLSVKEGNIIRDGYNETLDKYRSAMRDGKTWIARLEKEEREKTGIKSLKVGYNRVFGYYIEVTKANLHLIDDRYIRKQTLANAERFITPELKEMESLILEAEEKSVELEYELFIGIRDRVKKEIPRLQKLAKRISEIDCLQCFASVSDKNRFVRPIFSDDRRLEIKEGRHPVVEKVMERATYVPNDCYMDENREILLITGPNMSGKSTYMRQIALTAIMAQIGCFVPASRAVLPIFDQVFTRIGASDDLVHGQSTFMVEMLEAQYAIVHATKDSLILFDEIGRGTSTYDGMALAQAIIEYVHHKIGAKTLFSTHYHELTVLEERLPKLKNVHVAAVEQNGSVVFLHKIREGASDESYGIHVAKLAKLPDELIERAEEILRSLEGKEERTEGEETGAEKRKGGPAPASPVAAYAHDPGGPEDGEEADGFQLSFFGEEEMPKNSLTLKEKKVLQQLRSLNVLEMTPMDAMNALYELQKRLKK